MAQSPLLPDQHFLTASTITIEELSVTTPGGQPRRVILFGPSLPIKGGAKWGGDTRLITAWYPGNGDEATQQNLGPTEMPSDWNGEWNRTRMGRAPTLYYDETGASRSIVEPFDLYQVIDAIRISGSRLRATWSVRGSRQIGGGFGATPDPVDWSIVREGRLKQFVITPDTEVDIKWTMNFEWVSRGGRQNKAADVRSEDDLSQATNAVQQAIAALDFFTDTKIVSLKNGIRLSSSNLTLGQLEAMANAPKKLLDQAAAKLRYNLGQLNRLGKVVKTIGLAPVAMANSAIDFARDTTSVAKNFVNDFGHTPPELLSLKTKVSDLTRAVKYFGGASNHMTVCARGGAALEDKLRSVQTTGGNRGQITVRESATTRAGDVLAIYICKLGDTPSSLSSKYYNTPDHGDVILRANRLPTYTPRFNRGQIIVIPSLTAAGNRRTQ